MFIVPRPGCWESQSALYGVISYFHDSDLKFDARRGSAMFCLIILSPCVQVDWGVKRYICLRAPRIEGAWSSWNIAPPVLTSALHAPGRFTLKQRASGTPWIAGWVDPSVCLDAVKERKISVSYWQWNPGCPACSLSVYLLSYPGSSVRWGGYIREAVMTKWRYFTAHSENILGISCKENVNENCMNRNKRRNRFISALDILDTEECKLSKSVDGE
jgi:hypothetical protein